MTLAIILILALLVALYELPPLIKGRMWREIFTFLMLLALGVFLASTQALDIKIPNPVKGIEYIFSPVSEWVDKVLS